MTSTLLSHKIRGIDNNWLTTVLNQLPESLVTTTLKTATCDVEMMVTATKLQLLPHLRTTIQLTPSPKPSDVSCTIQMLARKVHFQEGQCDQCMMT